MSPNTFAGSAGIKGFSLFLEFWTAPRPTAGVNLGRAGE